MKLSKDCKFLIIYSAIGVGLSLLSLLFLLLNIYEISMTLAISYFFNFFTLLIMLKSNKELGKDGNFKTGEFTGLSILRFCLIGLSVLIPALLVKFSGDTTNNYRFLYVLISLVSFATVIGLFGAHSHGE